MAMNCNSVIKSLLFLNLKVFVDFKKANLETTLVQPKI